MYYVLHRPRDTDSPYLELPFRSQKEARTAVKTLADQKKPDGSQVCEVRLCIGKGRDRRTVLIL